MTKPSTAPKKLKLWVVMYRGAAGWLVSCDTGNPWRTKRAAISAMKHTGHDKRKIYTLVKFEAKVPKVNEDAHTR